MPRRPASEEMREAARERIHDAAISLWRAHGIDGVTVRGVAEACGYSVPTIYAHCGNRAEIVQSLWRVADDLFAGEARRIEALGLPPRARVRAALEAFFDVAYREPEIFRAVLLQSEPPPPGERPAIELGALPLTRVLMDALGEIEAEGVALPGGLRAATLAIWAAVHGAVALPVNLPKFCFGPREEMAAATIDYLLAALERPEGTKKGRG